MAQTVVSLDATSEWHGNDGNWSTFWIEIGSPPTNVSVLPATSGRSTYAVNPMFCPPAENSPSDVCAASRGRLFDPLKSSTWRNLSTIKNEYYGIDFGPEEALNPLLAPGLNYSSNATVGTDQLLLGTNGGELSITNALIASYTDVVPWIGALGLSAYNETILTAQDTHYSFLGYLNASGQVPSAFYGYTAGAYYRHSENQSRATASLTFGGYDASRANMNNAVTVPLSLSNTNRSIGVAIQNIVLRKHGTNRNVFMEPIVAQVDSLVSEIWLPQKGCEVFEEVFGLVWNDTVRYYLVDDKTHDALTQSNASVSFVLTSDIASLDSTTVVLPYNALQPAVGWPLLDRDDLNASGRYFPIRRSQNDDQYYLGRTFLQEAYLAVDYDSSQLHISPANFPPLAMPQDLRFPNGTSVVKPAGNKTDDNQTDGNKTGLSGGALAGIVVGAVLATTVVVAFFSWRYLTKRRKARRSQNAFVITHDGDAKPELDGTGMAEATSEDRKPELDSNEVSELQSEEHSQELEVRQMAELDSGGNQSHFMTELDAMETARNSGGGHAQLE